MPQPLSTTTTTDNNKEARWEMRNFQFTQWQILCNAHNATFISHGGEAPRHHAILQTQMNVCKI